jgi:hypothetical protein
MHSSASIIRSPQSRIETITLIFVIWLSSSSRFGRNPSSFLRPQSKLATHRVVNQKQIGKRMKLIGAKTIDISPSTKVQVNWWLQLLNMSRRRSKHHRTAYLCDARAVIQCTHHTRLGFRAARFMRRRDLTEDAKLIPGTIELAVGHRKWEGKSAATPRLSNLLHGNQQTLSATGEIQQVGSVRYSEVKGLDSATRPLLVWNADAADEPRPAHLPVE